jgi:hypothetical protein
MAQAIFPQSRPQNKCNESNRKVKRGESAAEYCKSNLPKQLKAFKFQPKIFYLKLSKLTTKQKLHSSILFL